jgi:uroporphyrinogen decarboxylase
MLYDGFIERLLPLLTGNMVLQAQGGADCVAIFDTAAGALGPEGFASQVVPALARLVHAFRARCPNTPVIYYSRDTDPAHWDALRDVDLQCLGIDWRHDMSDALHRYGDRWALQGNIDPQWLLLPRDELESRVRVFFARMLQLPPTRRAAWVCGLGHGVLQHTPEDNVRRVLQIQREMFA